MTEPNIQSAGSTDETSGGLGDIPTTLHATNPEHRKWRVYIGEWEVPNCWHADRAKGYAYFYPPGRKGDVQFTPSNIAADGRSLLMAEVHGPIEFRRQA